MPIKIKTLPPQEGAAASPHAQAAQELAPANVETHESMAVTGHDDAVHDYQADLQTEHVEAPVLHERLRVGMSFKMPVAPYVMVEFRVERDVPVELGGADDAFDVVKDWVEARINQLVEEQQAALPEDGSVLPQE